VYILFAVASLLWIPRLAARAVEITYFRILAARTPGLVGADLANIVNEAALLAARRGKPAVEMRDFVFGELSTGARDDLQRGDGDRPLDGDRVWHGGHARAGDLPSPPAAGPRRRTGLSARRRPRVPRVQ
jgi:hypothetical protein